jgi:hypothetical protein
VKAGLICSSSDISDDPELEPPVLQVACRLSRGDKKFYTEDKIKIERKPHEFVLKTTVKKDETTGNVDSKEPNNNSTLESGVGTLDSDKLSALSILPLATIAQGFIPAAVNASAFSPEDQTAIQECINELHYLPFTFELSKSDLASAFNRTVERMSRIFQKNNVHVSRSPAKGTIQDSLCLSGYVSLKE